VQKSNMAAAAILKWVKP